MLAELTSLYAELRSCPWKDFSRLSQPGLVRKTGSLTATARHPVGATCACESACVYVRERERVRGSRTAYIPQLFLSTHPSLITEFPPPEHSGSPRLHFLSTRGQIRKESKNDSIETGRLRVGKQCGAEEWEAAEAGTCAHDPSAQRAGRPPALISGHLKYLWKSSLVQLASSFLFPPTTCTWEQLCVPALFVEENVTAK